MSIYYGNLVDRPCVGMLIRRFSYFGDLYREVDAIIERKKFNKLTELICTSEFPTELTLRQRQAFTILRRASNSVA